MMRWTPDRVLNMLIPLTYNGIPTDMNFAKPSRKACPSVIRNRLHNAWKSRIRLSDAVPSTFEVRLFAVL